MFRTFAFALIFAIGFDQIALGGNYTAAAKYIVIQIINSVM